MATRPRPLSCAVVDITIIGDVIGVACDTVLAGFGGVRQARNLVNFDYPCSVTSRIFFNLLNNY